MRLHKKKRLRALEDRTPSERLESEESLNTRIGREIRDRLRKHPEESGVHLLQKAHDAFASRVLLARTAEKSLDIQYYIWKKDLTGMLMFKAVIDAADRGVRVRLLLDDNGIHGLDSELSALDQHPHIEVRLFNPFFLRRAKWTGFLTNFKKLNRRMHNKAFLADNQAAIVGGRNIGNEYFGAGTGALFSDLDVLVIGRVISDISRNFDIYWNSELSVPIRHVVQYRNSSMLKNTLKRISHLPPDPETEEYIQLIQEASFIQDLFSEKLNMRWAPVQLVSDDPSKILDKSKPGQLLKNQIQRIIGEPKRDVLLVSPYFVPTKAGVKLFRSMVKEGVRVRILTNSLNATDVKVVHAGYEKRRKQLLKSGVKLYEMKRIVDSSKSKEQAGPFGSSGSSLHAKTFSVDGKRIFVGSLNFDPRSINLNTEMGVVIESPEIAKEIQTIFDLRVLENSYEVLLKKNGGLRWIEKTENGDIVYNREPKTGWIQLRMIRFLSRLPIEWLL